MSREVERVEDKPYNLDTLDNNIMDLLEQFKIENNIEDMRKEPPSLLNAFFLKYTKPIFRENTYLYHADSNVNNAIDFDKVNKLLDIYVSIALSHDAPISAMGFSCFSGIPNTDISKWQYQTVPRGEISNNISPINNTIKGNTNRAQSVSASQVWKRLNEYSVMSWEQTKKLNDLRVIAVLNKITGGEYREYKQIDAGEISTQERHEIASKYAETPVIEGVALPDD